MMTDKENYFNMIQQRFYWRQKGEDYIIFKKKSAAQFSIAPVAPKIIRSIDKNTGREKLYLGSKKGGIYLKASNLIGENNYDWYNAITVRLSEHDIGNFLVGLRGEKISLYHDPFKNTDKEGQEVKYVNLVPSSSNIYLQVSMKNNGNLIKIEGVPIAPDERVVLNALLTNAIPKIMGW